MTYQKIILASLVAVSFTLEISLATEQIDVDTHNFLPWEEYIKQENDPKNQTKRDFEQEKKDFTNQSIKPNNETKPEKKNNFKDLPKSKKSLCTIL